MNKYIICFIISFVFSNFIVSAYINNKVQASVENSFELQVIQNISRNSNLNFNRQTFQNLAFSKRRDSNLYLIILNEFLIRSRENALVATASFEGITKSQLENILFQSEFILPIQDSVDSTNERNKQIINTYFFERDLFRDLTLLQLNTLAYELFANGTRSDSGFDLLSDLNDIEELLFSENSTSQFSGSINLDSSRVIENTLTSFQPVQSGSTNVTVDTSISEPVNDNQNNNSDTPSPTLTPNSASCPVDRDLIDALNDFDQSQVPSLNFNNDNFNPVTGLNSDPVRNGFVQPTLRPFTVLPSRCQAGGFSNDYLTFCVTTEIVRTKARSYFADRENCVACEIQEIAKIMDQVHSASLIPQKITGNFGEPAICKNYALSMFSMNINLVPAPARADLEILPLVQNLTVAEALNSIPSPPDLPTDQEVLALGIQNSPRGLNTGVIDIPTVANQLTNLDNIPRLVTTKNSVALETYSTYENQLNQRLTTLNQNYRLLLDQFTDINRNLNRVSQKGVCR